MIFEESFGFDFFNLSAAFGVKAFLILFLVFYNVFALLLYRQIQIMAKKLPTPLSPILKFIAIVHIGISLSILFLIAGSF
jgi:hypothetical protein